MTQRTRNAIGMFYVVAASSVIGVAFGVLVLYAAKAACR
jgi:hypothetical protein